MDRREFIKNSVGSAIAAGSGNLLAAVQTNRQASGGSASETKLAAYYIGANVYTCVPRHVRDDMDWMADKGTRYVCISILEQDLFASYENQALIVAEAERAGMHVLAVPSRWGGLTAGAPKVPSLFSVLNPQTWIVNERGSTRLMTKATGAIGSSFWPYYARMHGPWPIPDGGIAVPTGYAEFPHEILSPPRSLAARTYSDIRRWTVMPRGGHFAAMEQPEALAAEVRALFRPLRGSET